MTADNPGSDPAFLAAYGDAIHRLRYDQGLDRKNLALAAGISYSYLSAIESGQRLPSDTVQEAIARVLDVSPAELIARANGSVDVTPDTRSPELRAALEEAPVMMTAPDPYEVKYLADMVPGEDPVPSGHSLENARMARQVTPSADLRNGSRSERGSITTSGALAELRFLVPTLAPGDAELVVSLARRLAADEPLRRTPSRDRSRGGSRRESRTEAYLRFWSMYLAALEDRGLDWGAGRRPEPRSYFTTPSPLRGAAISASFARNRMLRHELYISRGSRTANLELLDELRSHRDVIESIYGHRLDFEDPGRDRRAVRIAEYREGHISRSDEYDDYIDWFIDRGVCMRTAIEGYLAVR
jgi:transcriptional regulator with XRE-family HTH domain